MKHIIIMILSCVLLTTVVNAQQDSISKVITQKEEKPEKRYKKVYWGLKAGGGLMLWENDFKSYQAVNTMALNGGFFIEYRPVKFVAIETGATYSIYSFEGSIEGYSAKLNGVDSEGDNVEYRFSASDVIEFQDLALLNVPIAIKVNAFAGNWEFFAKGGMEYRHAVKVAYEQNAQMTNQGYYEQWDLLIDNLPHQGYYTNRRFTENGDLKWKDTFDPFVGGGIVFPSRNTSFFIEGLYYFGGADFVEKQSNPFEGRMSNISVGSQKSGSLMENGVTKMSGFIINIGLRF